MSTKYTDLPLTNFPPTEVAPGGLTPPQLTEWAKSHADPMWSKKDVDSSTILADVAQYQTLMSSGNLSGANAYLTSHPQLLEYFLNAETHNRLSQQITALQRFYLEDFAAFVRQYVNAVPEGSTTVEGVVQLSNEIVDDQTKALTPRGALQGTTVTVGGMTISSGTNLNSVTTPGTHIKTSGSVTNAPSGVNTKFRLVVSRPFGASDTFVYQEMLVDNGLIFTRHSINSGTAWSTWGNPATYA